MKDATTRPQPVTTRAVTATRTAAATLEANWQLFEAAFAAMFVKLGAELVKRAAVRIPTRPMTS